MTRVAIVGGGMAGLAAAWRLSGAGATDNPPVQVTVYEESWQLGGKGASGRGRHGRIEEHGLHVWLGYYDNAFRLIRDVYADLDRARTDPDCPIQGWLDAFAPAARVGVEERGDQGWQHWVASFRSTSGLPGDPDAIGGTASVSEFLRRAVGLLADFSKSLLEMRAAAANSRPGIRPAIVLSGSPEAPCTADHKINTESEILDVAGMLQQAQFAAVIAAVQAIRLLGDLVPADTFETLAEQLARMRTDLDVIVGRGDASLRRLGELVDLVMTCCLGIVRDGLLTHPAGFGAIDDLDFRGWLAGHGARPGTLESALVAGMYDLVFAYREGDRQQPAFCAGLGLFLAGKFFWDYQGSLFWQLQAGMGEAVIAPIYQALLDRGVRFEFCHRLDRITIGPGAAVTGLQLTRTHRSVTGTYQPLIDVRGLPCFAAEPDPSQLTPDGGQLQLRAGDDFDTVVLAASLGSLAGPCQELAAHSPSWAALLTGVSTVATQSLQVWLRPTESELGWDFPSTTVSGYLPPFDTYASMTHLLAVEDWPEEDAPATLGYFCGSLHIADEAADPDQLVAANAAAFLDRHAGHFWPRATDSSGRFNSDLLTDQYIRTNATGSQRYVQSLPGSQRFRLQVDQSGFQRLVLAGDWTNCGLNAGCIEAAVLSGLQAANTILGRPLLDDIRGNWYGLSDHTNLAGSAR